METLNILKYLEENEVENAQVLKDFLKSRQDPYSRETLFGHITGSAFIVSEDKQQALLILHKKYNKWVAPGGHVDEGEDAKIASKRESGEEVGLQDLVLLQKDIFDIDIHRIPEVIKNGKVEPEHWHFDVRYLYQASDNCVVDINLVETKGFKWESLDNLASLDDISVSRQASKAKTILSPPVKKIKP